MRSSPTSTARRGVAEIEALFAMILLIGILLAAKGAIDVAGARFDAAHTAANDVFVDCVVSSTPRFAGGADYAPVEGFNSVRPGLPLRVSQVDARRQVSVGLGNHETISLQVGTDVMLIAPNWTLNANPAQVDDAPTQTWFERFADESHGELRAPLGLAPAWHP